MSESEGDDVSDFEDRITSPPRKSPPMSGEGAKYLLDQLREGQEEQKKRQQESRDEILEKLAKHQQKEQQIDNLQQEVNGLESQLESFKSSVPWVVYVTFGLGIGTLILSVIQNMSPFLIFMGFGMILLSIVAVFESKVNQNRMR